ncbi:MAG: ABC transporter ATP-binding protein [Clostridia bacterium]|nr:ABC transporter ATP-binding protein [Clostridia bacterium]
MLLRTEKLTKLYGIFRALNDLDMTIDRESIVGFVGPNGAGKTTAMRIIATLMPAWSGEVYINDEPIWKDVRASRRAIGFVPDYFGVYNAISSVEYLDYYADLNSIPRDGRRTLISDMLELVNLSDKAGTNVNTLSRGMKQRLCLARCLLHDPQLLILDEPASGLDPQARADLKYILRALRDQGKAILISSHILPELGEFCDKVVILNKGKKVADGTIEEISEMIGEKTKISYTLVGDEDFELAVGAARSAGVDGEIIRDGMVLEVEYSGGDAAIADLTRRMVLSGVRIVTVDRTRRTLEQVFLEVIDNDKKSE